MFEARLRPEGRNGPPSRRGAWAVTLVAAALALAIFFGPAAARAGVALATPALAPNEYVNVTATSTLSFVPGSFSVQPGALVHLRVTQGANFDHTFTLSSVANTSVPSVGYFNTHPPLVNLSLGAVAGKQFFANFTAPAVGTYEFVCEFHYPTMKGLMTSSVAAPGSTNGPAPVTPLEIGLALVVVAVLVGIVVVIAVHRRRVRDDALLGVDRRKRGGS